MKPYTYTDEQGSVTFDPNALCCIAQVPIDFSGGANIRVLGTGFYLSTDNVVVTAKHIFTDCDKDFGPPVIVNIGSNDEKGLAGHICHIMDLRSHGSLDIAMLVSGGSRPSMSPFFLGSHQQVGAAGLVTIGYSPSHSEIHANGMKLHISVNRCEMIDVEERERTCEPTEFSLLFKAPFGEKGNSGGPVLNCKGRVVGVFSQLCQSVKSTNEIAAHSHGRATSLSAIIELARQTTEFDTVLPELRKWFTGEIDSVDEVKSALNGLSSLQWTQLEEICRTMEARQPVPRKVPIWVDSDQ